MKFNSKVIKALIIILALLVALLIINMIFMSKSYSHRLSHEILQKEQLSANLSEKTALLASAQSRNTELEKKLGETEEYYLGYYKGIIEQNEEELKELAENNDKLKLALEKHKENEGFDITKLIAIGDEIRDIAENKFPLVRVEKCEEEIKAELEEAEDKEDIYYHKWVDASTYAEEGKKTYGSACNDKITKAELVAKTDAKAPNVAVYYEDLTTGYRYSYNGDYVFDSASVMKAPYVTAILSAADKYENGEIEASDSDERYSKESLDEMFNLEDKIILDHETMDVKGSGVLSKADDGSEYTYKELMALALNKSDTIALSLLKERFTSKWYFAFARESGAKAPLSQTNKMSVNDAGKLFKSIYYFTLENEKYGDFVKESMTDSSHKVLSQRVFGKSAAHKYGWDKLAYHDAAIVYGEYPYIAIVFTDLDCGSAADGYVRELFTGIKKMHEFFH